MSDSFNSQMNFESVVLPACSTLLKDDLWFRYRVLNSFSVIPMYILGGWFDGVTVAWYTMLFVLHALFNGQLFSSWQLH